MRFSIFLLIPVVTALTIQELHDDSIAQRNADVAQLDEALHDLRPRVSQASPPPTSGGGIGSALGDLTTLLGGLSDTLHAVCNLRQDVINVQGELGL